MDKIVIQPVMIHVTEDKRYVVRTKDGLDIACKSVQEAIKIKDEIIKDSKWS